VDLQAAHVTTCVSADAGCNEETSSACSSDSEDENEDQSTRGASSEASQAAPVKRKQDTASDGRFDVVDVIDLSSRVISTSDWRERT